MHVVAIIQSRVGSSRLPNKAFADIAGKSMTQRVVERTRAMPYISNVVLATAERTDTYAALAKLLRLDWFFGEGTIDPDNVLSRYYWAARAAKAEAVVRVTGDCPLLDSVLSGRVVADFLAAKADYASNLGPASDGFDTEVFTFDALARTWRRRDVDREHVTTWLRTADGIRRIHVPIDGPAVHLSVDTPDDLERVRAIYRTIGRDTFSREEALAVLPSLDQAP